MADVVRPNFIQTTHIHSTLAYITYFFKGCKVNKNKNLVLTQTTCDYWQGLEVNWNTWHSPERKHKFALESLPNLFCQWRCNHSCTHNWAALYRIHSAHPTWGRGLKGALKIACFKPPDWITTSRGITIRGQKHRTMNFGAWNVRALMDSATRDRPQSSLEN